MPAWLSPAEQKLSPASPSLQHSPKEHVAAAEARTCCRYQKRLTAPKAALCRRPVLWLRRCLRTVAKAEGFLNVLPIQTAPKQPGSAGGNPSNRSMRVPGDGAAPAGSIAARTRILLKNNIKMQIMQDF